MMLAAVLLPAAQVRALHASVGQGEVVVRRAHGAGHRRSAADPASLDVPAQVDQRHGGAVQHAHRRWQRRRRAIPLRPHPPRPARREDQPQRAAGAGRPGRGRDEVAPALRARSGRAAARVRGPRLRAAAIAGRHIFANAMLLPIRQRMVLAESSRELRRATARDRQGAALDQGPVPTAAAPRSSRSPASTCASVVRVAQFSAFERLFALWHVLHVPVRVPADRHGLFSRVRGPCVLSMAAPHPPIGPLRLRGGSAGRSGSRVLTGRGARARGCAAAPALAQSLESVLAPGKLGRRRTRSSKTTARSAISGSIAAPRTGFAWTATRTSART